MDRTILHIDMNSFYASVECLHDPSIRHLPVAVGGDVEARHGIILAKNEIAKRAGIKTGEVIWQAKQKCRELVIVPPHYDRYLRFSKMAQEIYSEYTDRIEPFGLDEVWVDLTNARRGCDGYAVAEEIRERVKFELGITCSIGVSFNKVFAKLGSDYKKPDAVTVFSRDNFKERVWPLPCGDLLYVGRSTERKLRDRGVDTIGDIAARGPKILKSWFGKWGEVLYLFAVGEDTSPVAKVTDNAVIKSIGNSSTTPKDITNEEEASIMFYVLAESVAERMRKEGFYARTVQVHLRDVDLLSFERQCKLSRPSCIASELHDAAMRLLHDNYSFAKPLRTIGIRATDLTTSGASYQIDLFLNAERREKLLTVEYTIDDIRKRFGHYAIGRGITMTDPALGSINPIDDHVIHPVGFFA